MLTSYFFHHTQLTSGSREFFKYQSEFIETTYNYYLEKEQERKEYLEKVAKSGAKINDNEMY